MLLPACPKFLGVKLSAHNLHEPSTAELCTNGDGGGRRGSGTRVCVQERESVCVWDTQEVSLLGRRALRLRPVRRPKLFPTPLSPPLGVRVCASVRAGTGANASLPGCGHTRKHTHKHKNTHTHTHTHTGSHTSRGRRVVAGAAARGAGLLHLVSRD